MRAPVLLGVVVCLAACPKIKTTTDAGSDAGPGETQDAGGSGAHPGRDGGPDASLPDASLPNVEAALSLWGEVTVTLDGGEDASVEVFLAQGDPLTLTATDSEGAVWTLTVPAGALTFPVSLKLIPLQAIDSSRAVVPMAGGVALEPHGLVFDKPATLTVVDENGDGRWLFTASADGGVLRLGQTDTKGAAPTSVLIRHFSLATAVAQANRAALETAIPSKVGGVLAAAQALIAAQALPYPPPPPITLHCLDPATLAPSLGAYAQAFFEPELSLQNDLVALWLAGLVPAASEDDVLRALVGLGGRMAQKVILALDDAGDRVETFPALFEAANLLRASWGPVEDAAGVVGHMGSAGLTDVLARVGAKVDRAANQLLDKVVIEHDYTYIPELLFLAGNAWDSSGSADNVVLTDKIQRALWFTISVDFAFDQTTVTASDTSWASTLHGAAAWEMSYGPGPAPSNPLCVGASICGAHDVTVTRGSIRGFSDDCSSSVHCGLLSPFTFSAQYALRHVVCGPPMTIDYVQVPFSTILGQAWDLVDAAPQCSGEARPLCCAPAPVLFGGGMTLVELVAFATSTTPPRLDGAATLTLNNKNAVAVDQTLAPAGASSSDTCIKPTSEQTSLHFVVTHTPNP